ncbi:3,4-dihydroxy-2-butanone-4-phosphate synthase [Pseudonocardia sp. NPDC049635]|uniref:3,4-dihydroxy-2-butanone-4-phosphate synthase n=1 Tax=Pseudonocardia sp. NPDC049635 TaxID=3155506 RepID=UPI0033E9C80E
MTLHTDHRPVLSAVEALAQGRPVLITGPDAGTVVLAAATASTTAVVWAVRHTCGLLRAAVEPVRADALRLPLMGGTDRERRGNLQTVAVDGAGTGTGISAAARATTLRMLADPGTAPEDLVVPGHVLVELVGTEPCPSTAGAVAQAAVRLCDRAGLAPVAALAEVVDDAGEPMGPAGLRALADRHSVPLISVSDLRTEGFCS